MGRRIDTPGAWQMPQGGVEPGEGPAAAALREIREEAGIAPEHVEVAEVAARTLRYDLPEPLRARFWGGRYRGQEQTWVAARFTGTDADINLDLAHEATPEFDAWRWTPLAAAPAEIVPFKRAVYEAVAQMFAPHAAARAS